MKKFYFKLWKHYTKDKTPTPVWEDGAPTYGMAKYFTFGLFKTFLCTLALILAGIGSWGQTANTYTFSTTTGGTLINPTYTTIVAGGNDDLSSAVQNIGFNFVYEGVTYTQFSANSNGLVRLGGTAVTTTWTNNLAGAGNEPKIMPLWDDLNTGTGNVRFGLSGTAPNRICVIDFRTVNSATNTTFNLRFQVRLYETTNKVEFMYSTGTTLSSASCGIGGLVSTNYSSVSTSTHTASTTTANNTNTAWPGSGRLYTWTPPTPPACNSTPSGLSATVTSITTATLSWTAASPAPGSGYDIYYSTSATPPVAGTPATTTTGPGIVTKNITGLTTNTTYYWWVRSNCNGTDKGFWVSGGTFYPGYCIPATTFGCTDGDVVARVILNTLDNNSGTGCPSGLTGYSDYSSNTSLTTTLSPGTAYNCTVYAGQYSQGYAAWIDYNDDGVFDNATERIGFSNGLVAGSGQVGVLGSSATFAISLACNPPAGPHRLRVRSMFFTNGVDVTPCGSNSFGETEDYTITIAAAPACPAPGLVTTLTPSFTTASITFALGCSSSTTFDFEYGPAGFTPGTGTLLSNQSVSISTPNASYTLTGLTAGTNYTVYYRANCGATQSTWSIANNFSTQPIPVCISAPTSPTNGANLCISGTPTILSWPAVANATVYDVYINTGTSATTLVSADLVSTSYNAGILPAGNYAWRIVPKNGSTGPSGCSDFAFTINSPSPSNTPGTYSSSVNIADGTTVVFENSCVTIGKTTDASGGNVPGNTTMTATVVSTMQSTNPDGWKYVRRSYTSTTASDGQRTLTFYFTQEDFNDYNANNYGSMDLPTSGNNSDPNKPYIRLITVTPTGYTVSASLGVNLTWNGTYWELTKLVPNVNGATYYISTQSSCEGVMVNGLAASNISSTNATLTWTAISPNPSTGYYELRYKPTASGTWINGGTANYLFTSKTYNTLSAGTQYEFQIRRVCSSDGFGAWSPSVIFNTTSSGCGSPMVFNAPTSTSSTVTLSWPAVTGAAWFEFQYKLSSSSTWINSGTLTGTGTTRTITGLTPNTSYDFRGRTYCPNNVASAWSTVVTKSTGTQSGCELPPNITASSITGTSITITWPAVPGAAWYEFRYKASTSSTWISAGTLTGTGTTRTLNGLTPNTQYDYQAKTFCTNGSPSSAWSSTLQFTTTGAAAIITPENNVMESSEGTADKDMAINEESGVAVNVYPNPTDDLVQVQVIIEQANETLIVRVFDMSGRLVQEAQALTEGGLTTIPLSMGVMMPGVYTVELYQNGALIHRARIQKN